MTTTVDVAPVAEPVFGRGNKYFSTFDASGEIRFPGIWLPGKGTPGVSGSSTVL